MREGLVWLASYPRCGNTLLRTVLWHCFGLKSGSLYPRDLGDNRRLEEYVGHIGHQAGGKIRVPAGNRRLLPLKTHEPPVNKAPAIYVMRDGRAAVVSLWMFYQKKIPLADVIAGRHRFGTWAGHLEAWRPWERPDTLLLRYEDLVNDLPSVLGRIGGFLGRDPVCQEIPDRGDITDIDGTWVRAISDWRPAFDDRQMEHFVSVNGSAMERAGYVD